MIYSQFNDYIKNKFFSSVSIGSHVVLSVDKQVIDEFCNYTKISEQQLNNEFKQRFYENWSFALQTENFFGLIAIQVYIAHLMHENHKNEKIISASNYNEIFSKYIGVSTSVIQRLYSDYQNNLWHKFADWAIQNSFSLNLPEKSEGPWSKVKYPLSQALLNQEDLAHLPNLFANVGLRSAESLSFIDFLGIVKKSESIQFLTNHYFKVKERLSKDDNEELLYRQVFEYYCSWDGEINKKERQKVKVISNIDEQRSQLFLTSDKTQLRIIYNNSPIENIDINSRDLFQKTNKYYRLPYSDIMIFVKDEIYEDWEITRYLEFGRTNLIICKRDDPYEYLAKRIDPNCILNQKRFYSLIEIDITQNYIPDSRWEQYFSKQALPVTIQNGLKIDRNAWIFQAGPDLYFDQKVDSWINSKKVEFPDDNLIIRLKECDIGMYVLKIRNHKPIHIEIREPGCNYSECIHGWQIDKNPAKWEPIKNQFQISGLVNTFSHEQAEEPAIREWIEVNLGIGKKKQNRNTPLITNAIKRAKYGI
jgi:hypothetical protein